MLLRLSPGDNHRNDEFKAIHIIADAVVLPDMTAHTMLFHLSGSAAINSVWRSPVKL